MKIVARNMREASHLDFLTQVKKLSRKFVHNILFLSEIKFNATRSLDICLNFNLTVLTL